MPKIEPYYHIQALDKFRTSIHKVVDGDFEGVYTQQNHANCDCPGAINHRTQCKHMLIRIAWESAGRPKGVYYTVDKARKVYQHIIPPVEE